MVFDSDIHYRRSIRLRGYDYSQEGGYFITICTEKRESLFGRVVNGKMDLNAAGRMVRDQWKQLLMRFWNIGLGEFIVMPNHFHGVITIDRRGESCIHPKTKTIQSLQGDHPPPPRLRRAGKDRPYGTIEYSTGRMIQALKSITTHRYIMGVKKNGWPPFPGRLWQRNYYEHIIRDQGDHDRITEYILTNPLHWDTDEENPKNCR